MSFEENSVFRGWFLSGALLHWAVSVLWQMTFFWISLIQIWFNWLFYTNSKSHNDFYMSSIGKKWFDWLWSKKRPKRMSFGICTFKLLSAGFLQKKFIPWWLQSHPMPSRQPRKFEIRDSGDNETVYWLGIQKCQAQGHILDVVQFRTGLGCARLTRLARWRLEVGPVGLKFEPASWLWGLGCEDSTAGCWIGQDVCRVGPANCRVQPLSH